MFTDAVLVFIGPDKIERVMAEMFRIARKAVLLCEWHCPGSKRLGSIFEYYWVRDYKALLEWFVPSDKISITKLPEEVWPGGGWGDFGAIIEVALE